MKKWVGALLLVGVLWYVPVSVVYASEYNEGNESVLVEQGCVREIGVVEESSSLKAEEITETNISVNTSYTGQLLAYDQIKKYNFSLSSPGKVNISFIHDHINVNSTYWVIRIYNANEECVMLMTSAGKETSKISEDLGLPAGNYYVKVNTYHYEQGYSSSSTSGYSNQMYTMKVNYEKNNYWESENNGSFEKADVIAVNTSYSGANQFEDDTDCYKFKLSSAGKVSINFQHAKIVTNDRLWIARIYNEDTESILEIYSQGADTSKTSAEVGLPAGNYYLQVNSCEYDSPSIYNDYSNQTYKVKINYEKSSYWETESNGSYEKADSVQLNKEYSGVNQFEEDEDYYKFTVGKSGNVNFAFRHERSDHSDAYWYADIYDANTNEVTKFTISGTDTNINTGAIYLNKGTYYLKMSANYYSSGINYRFKITYAITDAKPKLKIISSDTNKVKLSWDKISDADGYIIYRSNKKNGKYTKIKTVGRTNKNCIDSSIKAGNTYYYKIQAYKDVAGERYLSQYSVMAEAKAKPASIEIKNIKAGAKSATLTWKKQSGSTGYEIYMSTKKTKGFKKVKVFSKASTVKYTQKNLKKGKTYYFKIRSYKVVKGKKIYGDYGTVKSIKIKR